MSANAPPLLHALALQAQRGGVPLPVRAAFVPLVALLLLLSAAQQARAEDPCTLPPPGAPCLVAAVQQTPAQEVLAPAGDHLLIAGHGPHGRAQLQLYTAPAQGGPELLGRLEGDFGAIVVADDHLYARTSPTATLQIISIAAPTRPTQVGAFELPAGVLAGAPGALFFAPQAGGLQAYSLEQPARPALVASLAIAPIRALLVAADHLLALTDDALLVYPRTAPTGLGTPVALPYSDTLIAPIELLAHGEYIYIVGRDQVGFALCRTMRLSEPAGAGGSCPFLVGKTTLLGDYAYVNRNPTSAEYLEYEIWSLANGAAPQQMGTTPYRFAAAATFDGYLFASSFDHRPMRATQGVEGALHAVSLAWSASTLGATGERRLLQNGVLFVDMGPQERGRLLRRVAVDGDRPHLLSPDLMQDGLGAGVWQATGRHLYALTPSALKVFDLQYNRVLGSFALPAGETAARFVVAPSGVAYIAAQSGLLLAVDFADPAAPHEIDRLGLPGRAAQMLYTAGHLYLFGEGSLTVFALPSAAPFPDPRQIPIEGDVREVAALPGALLVRRSAGLQLLSLAAPLAPLPAPFVWGEGTLLRLLPAAGARAAIVVRTGSGSATRTELRIFEFSASQGRRIATIDTGGESDLLFDGRYVVFPSLLTLRVDGAERVAAPLTGMPAEFAPQPGLIYRLDGDLSAAAILQLCMEQITDFGSTAAIDGGLPGRPATWPAARLPLLRPQLIDCASGEPASPLPLTVEVSAELAGGDAERWQSATPAVDTGAAWTAPAALTGSAAEGWSFTLLPGQAWTLVGPPPAPLQLPIVRR